MNVTVSDADAPGEVVPYESRGRRDSYSDWVTRSLRSPLGAGASGDGSDVSGASGDDELLDVAPHKAYWAPSGEYTRDLAREVGAPEILAYWQAGALRDALFLLGDPGDGKNLAETGGVDPLADPGVIGTYTIRMVPAGALRDLVMSRDVKLRNAVAVPELPEGSYKKLMHGIVAGGGGTRVWCLPRRADCGWVTLRDDEWRDEPDWHGHASGLRTLTISRDPALITLGGDRPRCGVIQLHGVLAGKRCARDAGHGTNHLSAGRCVMHSGARNHGRALGAWLLGFGYADALNDRNVPRWVVANTADKSDVATDYYAPRGDEPVVGPRDGGDEWRAGDALLAAVHVAAGRLAECESALARTRLKLGVTELTRELRDTYGRHTVFGVPLSHWVLLSERWHTRLNHTARCAIDAGLGNTRVQRASRVETRARGVVDRVLTLLGDDLPGSELERQALRDRITGEISAQVAAVVASVERK